MKVAYDYQIFSSQKFGGVSRYFFELANHLATPEKFSIDCLVNSPVYINKYLSCRGSRLIVSGISVPAVPRTSRIYESINRLISPMTFRRWKPDIIHETYYSKRRIAPPGTRTIVTVYDMIHELYPHYFPALDRTRENKKITIDRADHVICISDNTKTDLVQLLDVAPEKITVVHLGFSLSQHGLAGLPEQSRPFLLYVGSRDGYKNFERLLFAYASHSELHADYDLIAFGGGAFKPQEVEMIRRLHLPMTQVRQISGDDRTLASLYRTAAVFAYPSLYEGFGIPPLEAMSFNCPVACSNTSSIPEVVGNAAVQFDPVDTDSIANALIRVTSDSALRAKLVDFGKTRLLQFSWEKCAKQTLDVYRTMVN